MYYVLNPIPTAAPNYSGSQGMLSITQYIFNQIVVFLQSVPVVPNSSGLYDSNGNWLTPTVSFFDALVAIFIIISFFAFIKSLTLSGGTVTGAASSRR